MKVEWKENLFDNDLFYEIDIANSLVKKSWFNDEQELRGFWFKVDGHFMHFETVDELKFLLKSFANTIDLNCEDISSKQIYVMKNDIPSIIIAKFTINYDIMKKDTYVMEWDFYEEEWEEWKKRIK